MLILTRHVGQSISIGDDIKVIIISDKQGIRVGIEAPKNIKILRDELKKKSQSHNQAG